MAFDPKPILQRLPNLPGVYRMKGAGDEVIYIGKARDLKKRVSSYFARQQPSPRIAMMVGQIEGIETTVVRSEAEALILENNLIKSFAPKYNVVFRDDKSYAYIMITGEPFPQIRFHRGSHTRPHRYYGPYPSAWAIRETINHLQRVFRLRTCENSVFANRSRPCLLHQIGRCSAPCVGLISADEYARDIANASLFLQGREHEVVDAITRKMDEAAARLDFESAATFRDQIRTLQRIAASQFVETRHTRDADVIAAVSVSGIWCVNLVMIRAGRHLGDKSFFPGNARDADESLVIGAFLDQHYAGQTPPARVIVDGDFDAEGISAGLSEVAGHEVRLVARPQGEARVWHEMAAKNARFAIDQRLADRASQEKKLTAMQDALGLPAMRRVECFDVSHTMGEATVASCVVFDHGAMQKSEYRRFNIEGITPGDDYAAMRDALLRRYRALAEPPEQDAAPRSRPDLVLIDGGKGQLGIAESVMGELGLTDIALVGVAKGEERRPGLETLISGYARLEMHLEKDHPGLHLIQQIRDEAHRFAITGHRARRSKARKTSRLDDIAGVGPKRKKALLARFGGLQGVADASVEDLMRVDGVSRDLATAIHAALH
ncbi:MAG TPA: excinuclease ABC subunit UvrC [Usitatibacteraceae bacterium]|nr:excinuclease ABC subunit UvrC [Usitatibacteraceae bacterium]